MVFDAFLSCPICVFELGYIQIFGLILLTFLHSSAKSSFRAYLEGIKEVPKRCINVQRDARAPETKILSVVLGPGGFTSEREYRLTLFCFFLCLFKANLYNRVN